MDKFEKNPGGKATGFRMDCVWGREVPGITCRLECMLTYVPYVGNLERCPD
jgi:hypothetical protein